MDDYYSEMNPAPPVGGAAGVGDSPYPFNDYADVSPQAPTGAGDHVGVSPYPAGWHLETEPKADRHDGNMEIHRGQPKPGSFSGPYTSHDGPDMS